MVLVTTSKKSEPLLAEINSKFADRITQPWLLVNTSEQILRVLNGDAEVYRYPISTSKYGNGCQQDSLQTPTGGHIVEKCIGGDQPAREVFVGRKPTGQLAEIISDPTASELDLILTRILWLKGLEKNKNLGQGCDSYDRYIYIHGTHEEGLLGTPASHGCVRMSNIDVIELYDHVAEGTFVYID